MDGAWERERRADVRRAEWAVDDVKPVTHVDCHNGANVEVVGGQPCQQCQSRQRRSIRYRMKQVAPPAGRWFRHARQAAWLQAWDQGGGDVQALPDGP